jgi:hypothetical protein
MLTTEITPWMVCNRATQEQLPSASIKKDALRSSAHPVAQLNLMTLRTDPFYLLQSFKCLNGYGCLLLR